MSLEDDIAELAFDTQGAYDRSGSVRFDYKTLEPWTSQRLSIAMELRCHVMRLVGPEAAEFIARGSYPNMFRDVQIVLYLSHLSVEELNEIDCSDSPRATYLPKVYEWCESVGIKFGSELYLEGVALTDRILREILDSMPFLADTGNGVKKNGAIYQAGKSGYSALRQKRLGTISSTSGHGSRSRAFYSSMLWLLSVTALSSLILRSGSRPWRTLKGRR